MACTSPAQALRSRPAPLLRLARLATERPARPRPTAEADRSALAAPLLGGLAAGGAAAASRSCRLRRTAAQATSETSSGRSAGTVVEDKVAAGSELDPSKEEDEPFFEEVSGDDPLVVELEERLRRMNGNSNLTLDMVLNPSTIVNTEREVILLRAELQATPDEEVEQRKKLEDKIETKQMKIVNEMRQVMTDSLKLEFILQAALSAIAFGAMCYDAFPWVPDLSWCGVNQRGVKLLLKLLGLWGIWLVTVPALRARKPGGPYGMGYEEKRALDLSFLALPFICIFVPFVNKDPVVSFWLSMLTLGGLYVWSFNTPLASTVGSIKRGAGEDLNLPEPVMWAIRALDFGTGSERGARSEDTTWKDQLARYEQAAQELVEKKKRAQKAKAAAATDAGTEA
eukprot:TRINITY_DN72425_c0_g1_i1.p1 TRINITY_DN72425_c0_g1~~TRINITY_DN72425_c0_g1_i1.p1  ORF type:complete len:413 (+),score=85.26 TRINITY_DN72425_c0_g1_i1:47-1240(+)